jgi:hypothetical protein
MLGTDRPSGRALSVGTAAALLAAVSLLLLAAPRAGAAAYYVGGGKGVKLAVRVVDRQIVWAKLSVREHCTGTGVVRNSFVNRSEGLVGPIDIKRTGWFRWDREDRIENKRLEQVSVKKIVGRVGPERLTGRLLYRLHFEFLGGSDKGKAGTCWSASGPSTRPAPIPITAHRRPEPAGLAFYYGGKEGGITTYFEVRRRRIVTVETSARLYCTDADGNRYFDYEARDWRVPIVIGRTGKFEEYEGDNGFPFETLKGEVQPGRITGSYGYSYADREGSCRTGSFEPGHGRGLAIPFVALRR